MMTMAIPAILILFYYFFFLCSILFNIKVSNIQFNFINIIFLVTLFILAFVHEPMPESDLTRYIEYLNLTRYSSWNSIQNHIGFYTDEIITNFYFFIMRIVNNKSWLPAIPTFITFSGIIYAGGRFRNKEEYSFRSYALFLIAIISVSSLSGIISGIRQNVAWMLMMLAVYYDFFSIKQKRILKIISYTLPLLIHNSTITIIAIRIIFYLTRRFSFMKNLKYLILLWPFMALLLTNYSNYLPVIIRNPLIDFQYYLDIEINYGVSIFLYFILYAILFLIVYKLINNIEFKLFMSSVEKYRKYLNFYIAVLLFGLASFTIPTLFKRTLEISMYISLPLFEEYFQYNERSSRFIILILILILCLTFYIQDKNFIFSFFKF